MAQQHGIKLRESDGPGTPYLFAIGVGLVASYNAEYTAINEAHWEGEQPVESNTLAELDAKYNCMEQCLTFTAEEKEEMLNELARCYLEWIASGCTNHLVEAQD